ncbi:MAG: hypothetical protein UMV23_05525, partial [Halanaerobium sp.]|nr:hypothetical protein [Halanaerobium sp.]
VNATIDDLRIIKALILASARWGKDDFAGFARELSRPLLEHNVAGAYLRAYDSPASPPAPYSYYDFKAMELMAEFDERWAEIAEAGKERILAKQVTGLPLYRANPNHDGGGFSTIENLLVLLHLSEVGEKDPQSLNWLKEELRKGGLFGSYSITGEPLNKVESPAIYGITAIIASLHHDQELYRLAIEKLKAMQHLERGEYFGGFIDMNSLSAYSFDQLFALLAYSLGNE